MGTSISPTAGRRSTTATVDHLVTFLARWPSAQSRYSIRSDIHQLYQFIAATARRLSRSDRHWTRPEAVPGVTPPRSPPPKSAACSPQPLRPADRLMVMLAACAGLRVSEIAAVRGEDVDLEGRWLTVTGKGGHRHTLPLAAELADVLEAWPRHGPLLAMAGGQCVGPDPHPVPPPRDRRPAPRPAALASPPRRWSGRGT